jgi:hypothetical protein
LVSKKFPLKNNEANMSFLQLNLFSFVPKKGAKKKKEKKSQ